MADFKELGRIRTTDTTELVMSEVYEGRECKGILLSKYITTEKYTGFAKGGVLIPSDSTIDFLKLFPKEDLELALQG